MKRLPCLVGRLWAASPSCQYVMNQTSSTSVWPSIRHPHHQFFTMCMFPINLLVWQLQSNHCVIITKRWLRITPWPGLPIKKRTLLLNQLPEIDWVPNIAVMCSHLKDFKIFLLNSNCRVKDILMGWVSVPECLVCLRAECFHKRNSTIDFASGVKCSLRS